jgi:formamidopyrimidine-DNA glycosylase
MPELPDITVYLEALEQRVLGRTLERVDIISPFVLRSVDPPLSAVSGARCAGLRRMGKRIVFELTTHNSHLFLVIHLMIAGRLHWFPAAPKINRKLTLAAFRFDNGTLTLTEAGSKRRASIHVALEAGLKEFERGGLEPLEITRDQFAERLRSENHTLKRSLTDPRLFSGIGNAYSDEILHQAKLSPLQLSTKLSDEQITTLYHAVQASLTDWTRRLRESAKGEFPEKVTAFRPDMAVHGRYKLPCPVCGVPVQRIRYADNETNYCARCQTGDRLLADRGLSRLLKGDWPRSIDELL